MSLSKTEIENFFHEYELRFNKAIVEELIDVDETVNAFASHCIAANPYGISCGSNDDAFRLVVKSGYLFYKKIGITSMNIQKTEIDILDDYHAMIKVIWKSSYKASNNSIEDITFPVIYLIQKINISIKIFAYITGDENEKLKSIGLI